MEYRKLGETGIEISALTFGAWVIGHWQGAHTSRTDAIAALQKAHERGATTIDTAAGYGLGYSEEIVGKVISELPRDRVQILTKCGTVWDGTNGKGMKTATIDYTGRLDYGMVDIYRYAGKESIIKQCEQSLLRLQTDYIDLFSIHFHDRTTPIEEAMEAFYTLIKQGKIRGAGLCNHPMEEVIRAENVICLTSNKVRYSMLNRGIENDFIPYSLEKKKGILAYSVLQRGILSGEDVQPFLWKLDENLREAYLYKPHNLKCIRRFLDKITRMASDYGATLPQFCIRWTISRPGITAGLLGATSVAQVEHDINAMNVNLTEHDMYMIDTLLDELEGELDLADATIHMEGNKIIFS